MTTGFIVNWVFDVKDLCSGRRSPWSWAARRWHQWWGNLPSLASGQQFNNLRMEKIWFPRWKIFELDGCEGAGKACLVFPPKSEGAQVRKSKGAQERNKRGSGRINKIKGEIMMKFVVLLFWNVQKVDETGNLHMELIPPEPQVIFGSCKKRSPQLLNGRFGSLIDPLSGTTLLLTFPGEKKKTKC